MAAAGGRSARSGRSGRYRYGAWAGGPDPLAPPYDVRGAVDEIGRTVLEGGSLRDALRDLLRRGPQGQRRGGLDDLAARVARRRAELRKSQNLAGTLDEVRELLDRAVRAEQDALFPDPADDARFREAVLAELPADTARAVTELAEYDWRSAEARAAYEQIGDLLRREVLDAQFRGLKQALADPDPAAMGRVKDMMSDLNALLEAHSRDADTPEQFADFMAKHGEFFPDAPADVDELIDSLARRAAAAQRLMQSLSAEQREQLGELMDQAMGDLDLAAEMSALGANLRSLRPGMDWSGRERRRGQGRGQGQGRGAGQGQGAGQGMGFGEGTGVLEELGDLDALAEQLAQDHPGATLDDVDVETLERQLGAGAAADLRRLRELEQQLSEQGWLQRTPGSGGGLTLAPKALRRLGQTALRAVFSQVHAGRRGTHDTRSAGAAGEATGSWREWEFGDEQPLDVVRTVTNAVLRSVRESAAAPDAAGLAGPAGPAGPRPGRVRLAPRDFAVVETEQRASTAVALCVDLSYSMVAEGRWGPMKETALALSHLIETRFPQDELQIIGFDRIARPMSTADLAAADPDLGLKGTNLQHALMHAARHLRRHPQSEPVVLVVTDGEPTAHLDAQGEAWFDWPPQPETIRATVDAVDVLTRYGATINTFMLGEDPGLRRFVDALARRNGGRVFSPDTDRLGTYVVSDYLRARRGRRAAA